MVVDESLRKQDPEIANLIQSELDRERDTIELIASENFTSRAVMEAVGSVLTNKYAEGYPAHRYYGGCVHVDSVEDIARERACALFGSQFANVQPHSGSQANYAAYAAIAEPGDTVMGMSLDNGGHLTHGAKVNFSGRLYNIVSYGVDHVSEQINYDKLEAQVARIKPKVLVAGASAYPRELDFLRLANIAHDNGAYLMVDMAHIAGLVAARVHPSPVPYADVVTSTSHKTLRGPRGGFILTNDAEIAKRLDKAIFPGSQGGPLMHVIAGKAVAFAEAAKPEFKQYAENVVANSAALGKGIVEGGLRLVSGGTDNHLCLVDLSAADITGKEAEDLLESVGMTVNKNTIPNEKRPPSVASGIRVGAAAATTRGFSSGDFLKIGKLIAKTVFNANDDAVLKDIGKETHEMLASHPLYKGLEY